MLNITEEKKRDWCNKLIGYRVVNEIYELHKGKLIKTININTKKGESEVNSFNTVSDSTSPTVLKMKGKVVNIKFLNNGTHVVCLLGANHFSQYMFDDYITFQKLSLEEQVIIQAQSFVSSFESTSL